MKDISGIWVVVSNKKTVASINEILKGFLNLNISQIIEEEKIFRKNFVSKITHKMTSTTDVLELPK
jgi:hypothetical protein